MFNFIYLIVIVLVLLIMTIKVVNEYERLVVFRLGKFHKVKGPGLVIIIPLIDKPVKISLRTVTLDVPPQDIITKDNVSVNVNAVVYFKVVYPEKAVIEVEDYMYATSQKAQVTLRSILGQFELDDLLSQREKINERLEAILDEATDPWGIKVLSVEIKHIDLPEEMKRAMARQAESERERRAKIIAADGELQASQKLLEAAQNMNKEPLTIQLRYLQTLTDVAAEKATTIVFPVPIELLSAFKNK